LPRFMCRADPRGALQKSAEIQTPSRHPTPHTKTHHHMSLIYSKRNCHNFNTRSLPLNTIQKLCLMKKTLCLSIIALSFVCIRAQLDFSSFSNSVNLTSGYSVHWKFNGDSSEITFGFSVASNGSYFGFGVGEDTTGSMKGADMLIVQFDSQLQKVSIGDYFANDFATPVLDSCQSWNLVSAAYLYSTGTMQVIVTRKTDIAGDHQDRPVQLEFNRPTKIVWAIGSSAKLSYHGSRRGVSDLFLAGEQKVNPDEYLHVDFTLNQFELASYPTLYYSQTFASPNLTSDVYIRGFQFIYANQLKKVILHHLVLYVCDFGNDTDFQSAFNSPKLSFNSNNCLTSLFAFGTWIPFMMLPENVHLTMGKSGYKYFRVEIHYDNPDQNSGEHDASGVRILYETNPRQYEAGFMQLGDPAVTNPAVIPMGSELHVEYDCPASMTSQMSSPIQIFSMLSHAHLTGSMLWSTLWKASAPSSGVELIRSEFYDYSIQHYTPMNVTVNPGDRISTHCIYNAKDSSQNVTFGVGTHDEMCITFVFYYPKNAFTYCGYYSTSDAPSTNFTLGPDVFTVSQVANPSQIDIPSGRERIGGTPFTGTCASVKTFLSIAQVIEDPVPAPRFTAVKVGVGFLIAFMALGGVVYIRRLRKKSKFEFDAAAESPQTETVTVR
jgi:dopamine beta-monooxygenase